MKITSFIAAAVAAFATPVLAEWQPSDPISLVIPYGAGGSTDTFGRVFANELEQQTGWTVLVENRTGAGGVVGQTYVANSEPDGLTWGLSSMQIFTIVPYLPQASTELTADSVDFIGTLSVIPFALVTSAQSPFDDMESLAAYTKENGPARFAATTAASTLAMERMAEQFGIEVAAAQTSGSAESLQLVSGRHADLAISGGVHVAQVLDGRLKVVAHMLDDRASYAPDASTIEEQGGVLPLRDYFIFNLPKRVPEEARATIVQAIDSVIKSDAIAAHAEKIYVEPNNLSPEEATKAAQDQATYWRESLTGN